LSKSPKESAMPDLNTTNLDKVHNQNHGTDASVASKLSQEASDAQRAKSTSNATGSANHESSTPAPKENLPNLTIVHPPAPAKTDWFSNVEHSAEGALQVAGDIGKGALNEVIHHPVELLKDAAVGLAIGAVAVAVAPEGVAVGTVAAVVGGVAALGMGAYEIVQHGGIQNTAKDLVNGAKNLGHSVAVEYDRNKFSSADHQKSKSVLEGVGAFGSEVAAGTAGFFAGGALAGVAKAGIIASLAKAAESGETIVPPSEVGAPVVATDTTPVVVNNTGVALGGDTTPIPANDTVPLAPASVSAETKAFALAEFPNATGDDQSFAINLAQQAEREGFKSPSYWAAKNLTDPAQIEQFSRLYASNYEAAMHNMEFMLTSGRIADGTADAWTAALAKLK
jgi:hypothetical protein